MTLCQKCYLFLISEFSWKDFVTRNEINQFLFVSHAVDVLAYVLRVVWWLWSTANLFKCSSGLWYRRQPPRLVNLHSFGLVASLVNTLPKRPPYAAVEQTHYFVSGLWLARTTASELIGRLSLLSLMSHPQSYWSRRSWEIFWRGSGKLENVCCKMKWI